MRLLLLSVDFLLLTAMAAEPERHIFTAGDHIITMDVRFAEPYVGKRLVFYDGKDQEVCLVGPGVCPDRFVGAVAWVTYTVKRAGNKLQPRTSIREYVTVTGQSAKLPALPPFDKTQVLTHGSASDFQAFGYDESDIAVGERESERHKSRERLWRQSRQELYLNDQVAPFAVIDWKYTIDAIDIQRVQGGKETVAPETKRALCRNP